MNIAVEDQRKSIAAVIGIIEEVYQHYPRMELSQLRVLLRVLEKPGIRATELATLTGLSRSALSRAVRILGSGSYTDDGDGKTKHGLDLITQIEDPADARAKLIAPTRLGRRIGEAFAHHVGVACGKTEGKPVAS